MTKKTSDLSEMIAHAISNAFYSEDYSLKLYDTLKKRSVKKSDVVDFLGSDSFSCIVCQIDEIVMYLNGASNLSESYDWMGKHRVLEFKQYLENIILDVKQYEIDRKPGRKKSSRKPPSDNNK